MLLFLHLYCAILSHTWDDLHNSFENIPGMLTRQPVHAVGGGLTSGDALHPSHTDGVTWARSRYFGKDRMVKYATL